MRERGVGIFCGKWLVDGLPQVILFDLGSVANHLSEWRHELFKEVIQNLKRRFNEAKNLNIQINKCFVGILLM